MIRTKIDNLPYSDTTKTIFSLLRKRYGYTIRISNFWKLLSDSIGIDKFELMDFNNLLNGPFETFLIDRQIDWMNGREVDFHEVYEKILEVGDFTRTEKELFESGEIQDRILGIYLAICNPELEEEIK